MAKAKKQCKDQVLAEISKGPNIKIRLTLNFWNGHQLLHAREWFMDQSSGTFKPGKNGLTFGSTETFTRFLRALLTSEKKVLKALRT